MSQRRSQDQSLPEATETRLGVGRVAGAVGEAARRAALEGARSTLAIAADLTPALPDAIREGTDRPDGRAATEQSEIERFRTVLGGRYRNGF